MTDYVDLSAKSPVDNVSTTPRDACIQYTRMPMGACVCNVHNTTQIIDGPHYVVHVDDSHAYIGCTVHGVCSQVVRALIASRAFIISGMMQKKAEAWNQYEKKYRKYKKGAL
jgi:hypothetical protein